MKPILELIQKPKAFDAFINENMKTSTYKVGWDVEMTVEYEASEAYQAYTADYTAAMVGTVIDSNSNRPKRDMPNLGELTGTLSRMGDEWQMENARLKQYYYMEDRFRTKMANFSEENKRTQYKNLVKFLFDPYEKAAIAPHRRILAHYWEGISDGQVTLTKTNNEGGVVWETALGNGILKSNLRNSDVIWSSGNLTTMDVLGTLQYLEDIADSNGKTVMKFRVSKATASLICQSKQMKELIGLSDGKLKTNSTPLLGIDTVNSYLTAIGHPTIEVINEKGVYNNGTVFSMFKDGRIVAQCADKIAVLKVTDPLESIDPVPNKVYTQYFDNLISQWRNENGRYIAYEMFAYPVFVGKNDVFILDVTQKD